jgi:hypothetical protein
MSMMSLRRVTAMCLAAACSLGLASTALGVGDVVISQVWGGSTSGTGTAALPKSDYVELFNRTANPINLTGWSIAVSTSGTGTAYAQLNLTGTIQPYSYYLIQCFLTPTTNGIALPTPDAIYGTTTSNLSATTGKVVLRNITTAIGTVGCPNIDANLIDLVTYGTTTTTCREGAANAPAGSTTGSGLADFRRAGGCIDTDDNGADFVTAVPAPRNSASPSTGGCVTGACCNNTSGVCGLDLSANCVSGGGTYQGNGTSCSPNPCPPSGACCSGTSTCTLLLPAGCASSGGVYQGDGTTCSPNTCSTSCCFPNGTCCNVFYSACTGQGGVPGAPGAACTAVGNCTTAPANDLCAGALNISAGTTYIGNNWSATTTGDGPNTTSEVTVQTKGVWFRFTPATTSVFDINDCGTTFDTTIQIFTIGNCADQSTWAYVAADDDKCAGGATEPGECATNGSALASSVQGVAMAGGQAYYIRLCLYNNSATGGGNYHLLVTDVGGTFGACCITATGQCELRTQAACIANDPVGVYQGDGTTCTPALCGTAVGACCAAGGVCVPRPMTGCTGTNVYQGDGTTCGPNPCITGACCSNTSTTCTIRPSGGCSATETYQGDNTVCSPNPCPSGACCNNSTGACTVGGITCSSTGTYQGLGTVCTPSPCPPTGSCCAPCTLACTTSLQAGCTGTWTSGGVCSPNPCLPTVLANDEPCGAIALAVSTLMTGNLINATNTNDGPAGACQTNANKGLWYSFQPAASGSFEIGTCGSTFDSVLTVFTGDCATPDSLTQVGCDDDSCAGGEATPCGSGTASTVAALIPAIQLDSSTRYLIRVQVFSTGTGATFGLIVNPVVSGACCNNTSGACSITTGATCSTTTSTFQGDGTTCTPTICGNTGACCNNTSGACTLVLAAGCSATTSTFQGENTTCSPSPCGTQGTCCNSVTGGCTITLQTTCTAANTTWTAGPTTCSPNPCPQPPPPANDDCPGPVLTLNVPVTSTTVNATGGTTASCTITCVDTWWDFTAPFSDTFIFECEQLPTGQPVVSLFNDCAQSSELACLSGGRLSPVTNHIFLNYAATAGQNIKVRVSSYACGGAAYTLVVHSTQPSGACCSGGSCSISLASACATGYAGDNTVCTPDPCSGACCSGSSCLLAPAAGCTGANTSFAGAGTVCNVPGNYSTPCCKADYNHSGSVTVQDIFDFLAGYFTADPKADINGVGGVTVQDIFDFLAAYFAGGC